MIHNVENFEAIVVWPLGAASLRRAIYLIEHHRMNEIPKDYRVALGYLLSRKWTKGLVLGKERKQD